MRAYIRELVYGQLKYLLWSLSSWKKIIYSLFL